MITASHNPFTDNGIKLVNATGAGDSMVAGFIAKTDAGVDYETALRFASACGTATAASKGIAKRATIDRVYEALCEMMNKKPQKGTKKV